MAKAHKKGRIGKQPVSKANMVSTGGPKKGFARKEIVRKPQVVATTEGGKKAVTPILNNVPLTVCVVPFHDSVFNSDLVQWLSQLVVVESSTTTASGIQIQRGRVPGQPKKRIELLTPNVRSNLVSVLDAAKVADVLLCVFPSHATFEESCFDPLGYETLSALRMQGLPPLVIGSVIGSGASEGIKTVQRYFVSEFSTDKAKFVIPSASAGGEDIAKQVLSCVLSSFSGNLSSTVSQGLALRKTRGYMLVDSIAAVPTPGDGRTHCVITGFSRGAGFGVKSAVHLTGFGSGVNTFRVEKIEVLDKDNGDVERVLVPTPEEVAEMEELLTALRPAEDQEQTWPTEEEEAAAVKNAHLFEKRMKRVVVPAGAGSLHEAAWLGEDAGEEMMEDVVGQDSLEQSFPLEEADQEGEDKELLAGMFDWDKLGGAEEEKPVMELEARSREDMDFVDEVDTPQQGTARARFQRYRGLKSLKNANWDPYEELPMEYSRIHEFEDINWIGKRTVEWLTTTGKDCVNEYCRVYLVSNEVGLTVDGGAVAGGLVASTVGPMESKMTVVHCRVAPVVGGQDTLPAHKQQVVVQCGFRRFVVRPIYSEIPKAVSGNNIVLQRMYRQLPIHVPAVTMSFYAPAVLGGGNCPVLVLSSADETNEEGKCLLWGSVAGCAPNKPIIVKRSTLTAYPFRVHQTKAVCRFMFFNPEDIDWFKPVELTTKKGLRGHIIESLGTHGYMKCRFNGQLTSDDVICLHLYKRVFPKFDI